MKCLVQTDTNAYYREIDRLEALPDDTEDRIDAEHDQMAANSSSIWDALAETDASHELVKHFKQWRNGEMDSLQAGKAMTDLFHSMNSELRQWATEKVEG